jgi:hypothetical protein
MASHDAVMPAPAAEAAEAEARRLWAENAEHEVFSFDDSGIGVTSGAASLSCAVSNSRASPGRATTVV